jgi:CubicO group peptidase (beta-lactamase class C family)
LILAEEGKLGVEDKVAKYFPDLTAAKDVTLYQLMTHTSGYPDYYPLDFVDRRLHRPIEPDALIRQYAGGKLDFPPGTRWSYSNTGYTILGRVVEKVSGEPFANFVKRRILDPVGMTHSAVDPAPGDASRARGYLSFALGAPEPARPETGGWLYAAGGLWASAPDLASWDLALMEGRVLPHDAFRRMATPVPLADGRVRDYGCGQNITRRGGETVLTHGGAISGFRAFNALVPRTKSAVVVLVNSEQPDDNLGQNLLNLVLKADAPASDVPRINGPAPAEAALAFFRQMAAGKLDRSQLGEEFSAYLSDERVLAAAPRLRALGEPEHVTVASVGERGGMEVASIHLTFKGATLTGLLYRSTDGKIQQLLFDAD